jgi:hypothetical protein
MTVEKFRPSEHPTTPETGREAGREDREFQRNNDRDSLANNWVPHFDLNN